MTKPKKKIKVIRAWAITHKDEIINAGGYWIRETKEDCNANVVLGKLNGSEYKVLPVQIKILNK